MQVLIQATVLGASRRTRAATAEKAAATYAEVFIATDMAGDPANVVGQSVTTIRLGDPRLVDAFRQAKLPAPFLLVADQQVYGEVTRTIVTDVRDALAPVKPAAAGVGR